MEKRFLKMLALLLAAVLLCAAAAEELAVEDAGGEALPLEAGGLVVAEAGEEAPVEANGSLARDPGPAADVELYRYDGTGEASIGEGAPAPQAEAQDPEAARANAVVAGLGVAERSPGQIQAFANAHPAYSGQVNLYTVAPTDAPYASGRLSPVNQRSALNLLNQMRYIAGLDASLTLLDGAEEMMASAALVLRLNGALTHYPDRPGALADSAYDDLYALGYEGAGHANIARGYKVTGAILAYMSDADADNADTVGHRRWILNPAMGATVMGANGSYSAMYAHDMSGAGGQTKVAWPARQMPVQYFSASDPWSLSYGRELDPALVSVTLTRRGDGATWRFSRAGADGLFNVDNHSYGQRGCVIFRPDGLEDIAAGDVFDVSVDDGAGEVTQYAVTFFTLDLSAAQPLAQPRVSARRTAKGNVLAWSAVSGAEGYYVCRRAGDGLYAVVADVKKTAWTDTALEAGVDYVYQVYTHSDSVTAAMASGVRPAAPAPKSVKLSRKGTVTLYTNRTLRLTATLKPAYAQAGLTWKSSKPRVAAVDGDGLVTPLKRGATVISVTADNGKSASVKVKVLEPPAPTGVRLEPAGPVTLDVGQKLSLAATLEPEYAASALTWRSADKRVARVSKKGVITGMKPGATVVVVTTENGRRAGVLVAVRDPSVPTAVTLNRSGTVKLRKGEKLWLLAFLTPDTAVSPFTWRSSKKSVATVSGKGIVTARKRGVTTITVKTDNGLKDSVKIRVVG